jgi:hypothetical protein
MMNHDYVIYIHVLFGLIFLGGSFLVLFLTEEDFDFRYGKQLASARINCRLGNWGKCDGDRRQVANCLRDTIPVC